MAKKPPKKTPRANQQYSYSDNGFVKVSLPLDAATDRRLAKRAKAEGRSKAKVARDLLAYALAIA